MKILRHFTVAKGVETFAASAGNQISESYYNFLVGEINRGTIKSAVCAIENRTFGVTSYHLISQM